MNAQAGATNDVAIGTKAQTTGDNSVAVGTEAIARAANTISIGHDAQSHAANAVAFGDGTEAAGERSFAIGTAATNRDGSANVDKGALAEGQGSIAFGDQAVAGIRDGQAKTETSVNDSMAIGTLSRAQARNTVAIGGAASYTTLPTTTSPAGDSYYYDGTQWVNGSQGDIPATLTGAQATGVGAVAIGGASYEQDGEENGLPKVKEGTYTAAAKATAAKSVALGTGSVADREAGAGGPGYDVTTGTAYAEADKDSATWTSTLGAFSIGGTSDAAIDGKAAEATRQLTGLAAGTADTDAVNVAQLKVLKGEVDEVAENVGLNVGDTVANTAPQTLKRTLFSVKGGEGWENEQLEIKMKSAGETFVSAPPAGYSSRNLTTRLATAPATDGSGNTNNSVYVLMSERPRFAEKVTVGEETGGNTTITPEGIEVSKSGKYQPIRIKQGDVSMGGNQIHDVAPGEEDTDAVNVSQLKNQHFGISAGGNASDVYGGDTISFVGDQNIHVNLDGQTVLIQLDPNLRVESITLGGNTRVDANGLTINGGPSVTVEGIDAADLPVINVADGIAPHDAVNKGQLDEVDRRLGGRIDSAYAGISTAVAQANIPQVMTPGAAMLGAGLGYFRDRAALGVGWSARSDNGHWVLRNSVGMHSEEVSVGGGIGYEF